MGAAPLGVRWPDSLPAAGMIKEALVRRLHGITLVLAAALLLVPDAVWAQKGPIKIGLILPETGPLAANGKDMANGMQLFFEEQGWRLAGREIKLITEDDEGKPPTGLAKARSLVESQGVHLLMGPLSAAVGYAVAPYVDAKKVPTIFPIVSAEDITQRKRSPYIVRTGWTSAQPSHPFGKWAYDNLGYRKIAMIGYDFAFGWEVAAGFQRTFEEAGGQVVQKLWPPLGTTDFAPYLAQIRRDADAVFAVMVAASSLRFPKQYQDAGLKDRLPLIGGGTTFDEFVLPSLGDEAIGGVSPLIYSAALDTPINRKFVKEFRAKFGKVPGYYAETCYTAARWINEGAKAVGGNVEDRDR